METQYAWMAGYFDGEGSFMIIKNERKGYIYYDCRISVSSTEDVPLIECKNIAGGYFNKKKFKPSSKNEYAKSARLWYLKGTSLDNLLPKIYPYLVLKKEQCMLLMYFRSGFTRGASDGIWGRKTDNERNEHRLMLKYAMNALNHRGTSDLSDEKRIGLEYWNKIKRSIDNNI